MNTNKISVILPIKTAKAIGFEDFFDKCIQSVKYQKDFLSELIIVHGDEDLLKNYLTSYDFEDLNVRLEMWSELPNFSKQVNHGVSVSNSDWLRF